MINRTTSLKENGFNTERELSSDNSKEIDDIRQQVKKLILDNLYMEITPDTKHNISGIYMI